MTAYTGEVLTTTGFSAQDDVATVLGKVSWTANLSTADTLTVSAAIPEGLKLIVDDFELYGDTPDTATTPAFAFKAGTEDDDDAFIPATVIKRGEQVITKGQGVAIGSTITDVTDIVITPTADPTTAVSAGDFFVKLTGRLQMK